MRGKDVPAGREINSTILRCESLINAIKRDEVMIYSCIGHKPTNVGCELTERQYQIIEALVMYFLEQNVNNYKMDQMRLWQGEYKG